MNLDDKIFVAGHNGLVGKAITSRLVSLGYKNVITQDRKQLDLCKKQHVENFFQCYKPNYVINAAAKVGGIHANNTFPADFILENLEIQNNLIHSSWLHGVKKFLFLGSVCIYPKFATVPIKEESLLTGMLEPTNEAYAIAKIAGIKMCQAYYRQHGFQSVCIMPSNLYGPGDNFHPENSHVIPGMIHKLATNNTQVVFWGDGSAQREFLHVDDMAAACLFLLKHPETGYGDVYNAGSGENISIKKLSDILVNITKYTGNITWDRDKPNGTPNRPLDSSKIRNLGWTPKIKLNDGLQNTYEWYLQNINNIRKI